VQQDPRAIQAIQEPLAKLDRLVQLAHKGLLVILDHKACKVSKAKLVQLDPKVFREKLVLLVPLVHKVSKASKVFRVSRVKQDQQVLLAKLEHKDQKDQQDRQG
jgi:hypothetical protein